MIQVLFKYSGRQIFRGLKFVSHSFANIHRMSNITMTVNEEVKTKSVILLC